MRLFYLNKLKYTAETHRRVKFLNILILDLTVLGGFSKILIRPGKDKFKWRRPILWFWKLIE